MSWAWCNLFRSYSWHRYMHWWTNTGWGGESWEETEEWSCSWLWRHPTSTPQMCPSTFLKHCIRCSSVWRSGHVPVEWKDGIIVSLYKGKGPKWNAVQTYLLSPLRAGKSLLTHPVGAYTASSTNDSMDATVRFTAGRSTINAILALLLLLELHPQFNRPLYVAFVYIKSAFNSVDRRNALWKALCARLSFASDQRPSHSYWCHSKNWEHCFP